MRRSSTSCLVLVAAFLSACSNAPEQQGQNAIIATMKAALMAHRSSGGAKVDENAPIPKNLPDVPLLRVSLPKVSGYVGYFSVYGRNGDVVTWVAPQAADLSLRDGVLVASRGLAKDLMSSDPPSVAELSKGKGVFTVHMNYLNGADGIFTYTYRCTLSMDGNDVANIAGKQRSLKRIVQACTGDGPAFTNAYWIDSQKRIWRSRQWVSALSGYAHVTVVNDRVPR